MSVPRPAMLVAMVTLPLRPACATISASCAWYLAFSTTCLMPRLRSSVDSRSDFSIDTVPTSVGRPDVLLLEDVVDDRLVLLALGAVDEVRLLDALQRPVGRDDDDVEVVDLVELGRLGLGRAGHARQLLVLAEVVLEGDGGERLVLALDLHLLLGLDRLVQAVAPAAARHQAAGELVDDDDPAVLDHVVDVELEQRVRAQRPGARGGAAACWPGRRGRSSPGTSRCDEHLLGLGHAGLGQRHRLVLLVDDVVAGRLELLAILGLDVALGDGALLQPAG